MYANEQRLIRVKFLKEIISKACAEGFDVSEEKTISVIMQTFGTSRRTTLEYLDELVQADFIIREDKKIWTKAAWEAKQILIKANAKMERQTDKILDEQRPNNAEEPNRACPPPALA